MELIKSWKPFAQKQETTKQLAIMGLSSSQSISVVDKMEVCAALGLRLGFFIDRNSHTRRMQQ